MIQIYCIEDCDGLKYVGSTKQTLEERLYHHKYYEDCKSRELKLDDCKIYTLEECQEEQRKEREQYWIDNTDCVNYLNPIFDRKEYNKKNKDKKNEYMKEYNKKNRDKNIEYQKQYRKKNRDKILKDKVFYGRYTRSWGGDPRYSNNLLKIDLNIFL